MPRWPPGADGAGRDSAVRAKATVMAMMSAAPKSRRALKGPRVNGLPPSNGSFGCGESGGSSGGSDHGQGEGNGGEKAAATSFDSAPDTALAVSA